jgi:FtsH-binding integral membrane protein
MLADAGASRHTAPVDSEAEPLMGGQVVDIKRATIELRRGFVRKVYSILATQLLLTTLIAVPLQTVSALWMRNNMWLMWVAVGMTLVTICAMTCCQDLARNYPTNYILLFTFTTFEGVLVGFVSAQYTWQSVMLAAGVTVVIFLGMTAFAWNTETDFTGMGPYFFAALMVFAGFGLVIGIMGMCGVHIAWMMMLYDALGVLIFTMYIVFDTQLILGEWGGHSNQFSVDDYVFGALTLYLDIINLFLHLLRLLGERK